MMTKTALSVAALGDREVLITRQFDAPRHLVFEAYTRPELLRRWMTGPDGWVMTVCEIDLTVGGRYRYAWTKDDGAEMGMGGVFREIEAPARLVSAEAFDADWTGGETVSTLVLTEEGGRTTLSNTVLYSSAEARDGALRSNMETGMAMSYGRLDAILRELAQPVT